MKTISAFAQHIRPWTILAGLLLVFVLNFGLPNTQAQAGPLPATTATPTPDASCNSSRHVDVSGSAVVNVPPDRAKIDLGVQTNGTSPEDVEAANSAAVQAVIAAIKRLGVEAKDISTDWYSVEPVYENYDSLFIKGYRVRNTVSVTLRDVSKSGDVVSVALRAGANQVVNVELYTSEFRKYRDQARDAAMKAAVEKARALAKAAGSETGCTLTITENTSSYYNGWWWYGRSQNAMAQNSIQNVEPAGGASSSGTGEEPISLGQIAVKAEVTASFSLK